LPIDKQTEAAAERKTAADLTRVAVNHQRATFATNSGNTLLEKGQIADAITRYQEALSNDPKFADAHRQLALALDRQAASGSRGRTKKSNRTRIKTLIAHSEKGPRKSDGRLNRRGLRGSTSLVSRPGAPVDSYLGSRGRERMRRVTAQL
jgi:tetratricopeptide (TPR) repeat protein